MHGIACMAIVRTNVRIEDRNYDSEKWILNCFILCCWLNFSALSVHVEGSWKIRSNPLNQWYHGDFVRRLKLHQITSSAITGEQSYAGGLMFGLWSCAIAHTYRQTQILLACCLFSNTSSSIVQTKGIHSHRHQNEPVEWVWLSMRVSVTSEQCVWFVFIFYFCFA